MPPKHNPKSKSTEGKIVNPSTQRLVDMNSALGRSLLVKYAPELVPKFDEDGKLVTKK
jgi:hypothetical protein